MIPTLFLRTCLTRLNFLQTNHSTCFPAYFFFFFLQSLVTIKASWRIGSVVPRTPTPQPNLSGRLKLNKSFLTSNGGCCDYFKSVSFFFFFCLQHTVSPDQSKRISRLIYSRIGIPVKILIDPPNLGQIRLIYNKKILI